MKQPAYLEILNKEYLKKNKKNELYSIRAFAKSLDIDSGALSQILSGKRIVSYKTAMKICQHLQLGQLERRRFLYSLAKVYQKQNLKRKSPEYHSILKDKDARLLEASEIEFDETEIIANWYYVAIMEMTYLKDTELCAKSISKMLGISILESQVALNYLFQKGFLELDINGKPQKVIKQLTTANQQKTSKAHKQRQNEILDKSKEALNQQDISMRAHHSMTMAIDPTKITQAKEEIRIFMSKMCDLLETGNRTDLYELNIGLFSLTQNKEKI